MEKICCCWVFRFTMRLLWSRSSEEVLLEELLDLSTTLFFLMVGRGWVLGEEAATGIMLLMAGMGFSTAFILIFNGSPVLMAAGSQEQQQNAIINLSMDLLQQQPQMQHKVIRTITVVVMAPMLVE